MVRLKYRKIVTGATGSLGAHVVAQLAATPDVKRIYCLVRAASSRVAHLRVVKSMQERAVYDTLPFLSRQKILALPSNLAEQDLGLGPELYSQIANEITGIIHCAWSVNFNLGLGSFENDCIAGKSYVCPPFWSRALLSNVFAVKGARNLMLLCLASAWPIPAAFNFCSSVSTVAATPGGFVPETLPPSLSCTQGMGYAQSKLVTEHLVQRAGSQTGMRARVLRVGQIIADTQYGIWNDTEAIPLILQAGTTIGAIPALDESPLWLPVDVVARTVIEISLSDAPTSVLNVVNGRPFHWTRDLLPKLRATGFQFEEIGQREWIMRLRASNFDPVANPPIKLVEFFASKYDKDNVARIGLQYDTSQARALSPTLASAPVLDQEMVQKFIEHFLRTSWKKCTNTDNRGTAASVGTDPDIV